MIKYKFNPFTGTFDLIEDSDGAYLKLDQTTPESVINGTPCFDDICIPDMNLGTPTYGTVKETFNLMFSAGRLTGGEISILSVTSGTVIVDAGTGTLRVADDDISQIKFFDWATSSAITITSNTIAYIGIEYNSGTPQVTKRATQNWNYDTDFPLGSVINQAGDLYHMCDPWWTGDGLTNVIERFQSEGTIRDNMVGGLIIGTSSTNTTRKPTLSAGTAWSRLTEFDIDAKDCSGTDTFFGYYRDGSGGWTKTAAKTDIDDFYDNNSGTLQAMTANRYCNFWFFVEVDTDAGGQLMMVYPQTQYVSSAVAEGEDVPVFPSIWYKHGLFLGKIMCKTGTTVPIEISTVFSNQFTPALAADHGNLSGLTDNDHPQYVLDSTRNFPDGTVINGVITPTVASNNITVAIKTHAGADPSASDPVYVYIGGVRRSITAALSVTRNAGTDWFGCGSTLLATLEVDFFTYFGYNATDGVVLGFARIPHGTTYGDFSTTTTANKYCAISTITNATATDRYENVGRFTAILSGTASYNWSIPATGIVLNHPCYETRWLTWTPTLASTATISGYTRATYIVRGASCKVHFYTGQCNVTGAGGYYRLLLPILGIPTICSASQMFFNGATWQVTQQIGQPSAQRIDIYKGIGLTAWAGTEVNVQIASDLEYQI